MQGEELEGADDQGAGGQSRPVRRTFCWDPPPQRQPREDVNEEDKEIKELRPKDSSHLNG